jgi:hypothetical protein
MPSFKLIKPYGHRYKDADNSLQHHAQHKQKQICNKPCLQRRGPSRSVSRKKHTAAKTSQSTVITPPEDQHQGNSGSAQISSLAAEGPCPLALDRRASHRQTRVCSPLNKENCCPRDSHRGSIMQAFSQRQARICSNSFDRNIREEKGKLGGSQRTRRCRGVEQGRGRPSPATLPAAAAAHRSLQTGNSHQLPPAPDGASREGVTPWRRRRPIRRFWAFARDGGRGWGGRASAVPPGR